MTNIYQDIHNEQLKQVEQIEADYNNYLKKYNGIKSNKVLRYIGRSGLRALAVFCYVLFAVFAISIIAGLYNWDINVHLTNFALSKTDSHLYKTLLLIAIYAFLLLWPALAFLVCGLLVARIRKRNKLIHSLADLLEQIISKTETNLNKAKQTQKDFELFAAEIVKRQVGNT